jgi:uncharacterized membrane protein YedE/YeeE
MKSKVYTLLVGIYFGIVLVKTQVVSWFEINDMFLFKDPYMYLVIASAIGVGVVSVYFIKRYNPKALCGADIIISQKPLHKGLIFGGTLFGMGWAITGACPGPIYAQIGAGTLLTIFTFLGAMAGMYLYAYLQPLLPTTWRRLKASAPSTD